MRLHIQTLCFIVLFLFFSVTGTGAPKRSPEFEKYIEKYCDLAMMHQKKYKIPASIKLAQALAESGGGKSPLALKANNHFGIKCHGWKGKGVSHDDDLRGECFRKYDSVEDSYDDHSRFLSERTYYKDLFKLNIEDYKGWAKGLLKSGYATNPQYANKLIKLIEDYELYKYDKGKKSSNKLDSKKKGVTAKEPDNKPSSVERVERKVHESYGLSYVYAIDNDSFEQIAIMLKVKAEDLRQYNEVPEDYPLRKGDIVYLEKKKKKADKPNYDHVVQKGESMYSISQKYGIQIKSLYKVNKKKPDYVAKEGDVLKLR